MVVMLYIHKSLLGKTFLQAEFVLGSWVLGLVWVLGFWWGFLVFGFLVLFFFKKKKQPRY